MRPHGPRRRERRPVLRLEADRMPARQYLLHYEGYGMDDVAQERRLTGNAQTGTNQSPLRSSGLPAERAGSRVFAGDDPIDSANGSGKSIRPRKEGPTQAETPTLIRTS